MVELLPFDALRMSFKELQLQKDPQCPICGKNVTIKSLIDYETSCGLAESGALNEENEITVAELKQRMDRGHVNLIDVRDAHEYEICRISGSRLLLFKINPDRVNEFNLTDEYIFH